MYNEFENYCTSSLKSTYSFTTSKKEKHYWWTTTHDSAFDIYFLKSGSYSEEERDNIFNDLLYPALYILGKKIIDRNNYHNYMHVSSDELINMAITHTLKSCPKYRYNGGASRSSWALLCMSRYVYHQYKKYKNINMHEISDDLTFDDSDDQIHLIDQYQMKEYNHNAVDLYNDDNFIFEIVKFYKEILKNDNNIKLHFDLKKYRINKKILSVILSLIENVLNYNCTSKKEIKTNGRQKIFSKKQYRTILNKKTKYIGSRRITSMIEKLININQKLKKQYLDTGTVSRITT